MAEVIFALSYNEKILLVIYFQVIKINASQALECTLKKYAFNLTPQ